MKNSQNLTHTHRLIVLIGFTALTVLTSIATYAQDNIFPASNRVGIGTGVPTAEGPDDILHIRGADVTPPTVFSHPALRISLSTGGTASTAGTTSNFGQLAMENTEMNYSSIAQKFDFILRADASAKDLILSTCNSGSAIRFATTRPEATTPPAIGPEADIERMTIAGNGCVGINQNNPQEMLDIKGDIMLEGDDFNWPTNQKTGRCVYGGSDFSKLSFYSNKSYVDSRTYIEMFGNYDPTRQGELSLSGNHVRIFSGNNGTGNWGTGMEIALAVASNHNVGIGTNYSTGNEDYSPSARLEVNGDLAAGTNLGMSTGFEEFHVHMATNTSTDDGYVVVGSGGSGGTLPTPATGLTLRLRVNGSMVAKEIWTSTLWSDYVFNDDYHLMPIEELGKLVKATKHLPDMPTADEVAKQGISVGDVESKLLKKVEELTLYVLQLHDENKSLKNQIEKLEKQ